MTPAGHPVPAPGFQRRALHPSTPTEGPHRHNSRYIASYVGAPADTPTQHSSHSLRARARRTSNERYVGMSRATTPTDTPTQDYNYQPHCGRTPMWPLNENYVGYVGAGSQ